MLAGVLRASAERVANDNAHTRGEHRGNLQYVREFVNGPQLRHLIVRGEVETHADATTLTGKLTAFTATSAASCMKQFVGRLFAALLDALTPFPEARQAAAAAVEAGKSKKPRRENRLDDLLR